MPDRRRTSARAAALPARPAGLDARQLIPSGRSVAVGVLLLALAVACYIGARQTSVFAVRTIDVRGGTPQLRAQVRDALAGELGTSLVVVDDGSLSHRISTLAGVRSFTYDRDFPHTLRVVVQREIPVLVVRQVPGSAAFLVASTGKVIRALAHSQRSNLPRLWVTKKVQLAVGSRVPVALLPAAASLASLRGSGLPGGVHTVTVGDTGLTLILGGGLEVRLGDPGDIRLKLAIARRILAATGAATAGGGYLDVSVPERPVLSSNSQVEG